MVNSSLNQIVRQVRATTLSGHHTGATLETLERVVVEHFLTLGNARSPGSLVACFRSAGNTGTPVSQAITSSRTGIPLRLAVQPIDEKRS